MPVAPRLAAFIDKALILGITIAATGGAALLGVVGSETGQTGIPNTAYATAGGGDRAGGSCCMPDGSCMEVPDANTCTGAGGSYNSGGDCDTTGSCLFDDDCIVTTQQCCTHVGGAWTSGGTCDDGNCLPSFSLAADADADERPFDAFWILEHVYATGSGRAITAFVDPNQTLQVLGTSDPESIRLHITTSGQGLRVLSPEDGSGQVFSFLLTSFARINIALGDESDLIIFDDVNGSVSSAKPFSVDAGDGGDTVITQTNGLTLSQVLTLVNTIQTLNNLTVQADQIRQIAGTVATFPAASGDMASDAVALLAELEALYITPTKQFIDDLKTQMIEPAAQAAVDTRDQLIANGMPLILDAYADLALAADALCLDANVNIVGPALNLLAVAQNSLIPDANSVSNCAAGQLAGPELTAFRTNLENAINQIIAISDLCPPDPTEPPEAADGCAFLQELMDCIEFDIENFEALAEICEDEADDFQVDSDLFEATADDLELYAEGFESSLEAFEGEADPNYVTAAEAYESYAESFVATLEASFGTNGAAFDGAADSLYRNTADSYYEPQMEALVRAKSDQIQSQADQITQDAEDVIAAAVALLGAGALNEPRASSCANITTTNTITGGPGPNILIGSFGNDLIYGMGGNDLIVGLPGDDRLFGGDGTDLILGNAGTNEIHGDDAIDILIGGTATDCIYGEDGIDLIVGRGGNDEIDGGSNVDVLIANAGDDQVWGRDGMDVIIGGDGADKLYGGHCIDVIVGGSGADTIVGGHGQLVSISSVSLDVGDLLIGGPDDDTIYGDELSKNGGGVDVIFGGDGNDKIYAADGGTLTINSFTLELGNVVFGGDGNDTIESKKGICVLFGGAGNDTITADEGDNITFPNSTFEMAFGDLLFGGTGNDTLNGDNPDPNQPRDIDLLFGWDGNDIINAYDGGLVKFSSTFEMKFGNLLIGGTGADTLTSGEGIDFAFGGPGDDKIRGGKGYLLDVNSNFYIDIGDFLFGQGDNDVINANDPNQPSTVAADGIDVVFGGPGDDQLYGDGGGIVVFGTTAAFFFGNFMFGEDGNDLIKGGYQNADPNNPPDGIDLIFGAADNDTIDGIRGSPLVVITGAGVFAVDFGDIVFGGPENDTIDTGASMDFVFCGRGNDNAETRAGIDFVFGSQGDDILDVGDGGTLIIPPAIPITFGNIAFGGDDDDTIHSAGNFNPIFPDFDLLFGNKCDDTIFAGDGILDLVFGGPGFDELHGEDGPDMLFGGKQDDIIYAGDGLLDVSFGGRDEDEIHGELGIDLAFGGQENDDVNGDDGIDILFAGRGGDVVHGGLGTDLVFGNKGGDDVYGDGDLDLVFGNIGDDRVHGGSGPDLVFGGKDRDYVYGDSGPDLLFGGLGDDVVSGGDDPDLVFGGQGNDRVGGDSGVDVVFGGQQNDIILPDPSFSVAFGGLDNDFLLGDSGVDVFFAGKQDDYLYGNAGDDFLFGGANNDVIWGGANEDFLFAGSEDDIVYGNEARDRMFGNLDNDCLDSGAGDDRVFGNRGKDQVRSGNDGGDVDRLFGGRDNDTLWGCQNNDKLRGGPGNDIKDPNNCNGCTSSPPSCAEIIGTVYVDKNGDNILDGGLAGAVVYADLNTNLVRDVGEPFAVTPADDPDTFYDDAGTYRLAYFQSGPGAPSYRIRVENYPGYAFLPPGQQQTWNFGLCVTATVNFALRDVCRGTVANPCSQCDCPSGYHSVLVTAGQPYCDYDGAPCSTSDDCLCGGNCVTPVATECICVPDDICILAGDRDNFELPGDPNDTIVMFSPFQAFVNRPGGVNQLFHAGQSLPFDQGPIAIQNWEFGYSFLGLPQIGSATLEIHLRATAPGSSSDRMALQFVGGSSFQWFAALNNLDAYFGGNGLWAQPDDRVMLFDLAALPRFPGPALNLLPFMNADGRLDVYIENDTAVDYIELCYMPLGLNAEVVRARLVPPPPAAADVAAPVESPQFVRAAEERGTPPNPPAPAPSPFDLPKNRYISFFPNNGAAQVAFEVVIPPCRRAWVGPPRLRGQPGTLDFAWVSDLVEQPHYQSWDMEVVHVHGCPIIPEKVYDVRAVSIGGDNSPSLSIPTAPVWGDVDADGITTFFDLQLVIAKVGDPLGEPHMVFVDLAPQWVDYLCDSQDTQAMFDSFNGPYPPPSFAIEDYGNCPLQAPCTPPCADVNFDGLVDLLDFLLMAECLSGPGNPLPSTCLSADIDQDADVDMVELAQFQAAVNSSPPNPCGTGTLTQSTDPNVIVGPSVWCGNQTANAGTSIARGFVSPDSRVLRCVTFGIRDNTGGDWPVTVRVLQGAISAPYGSLTLLSQLQVTIPSGATAAFFTADIPDVALVAGAEYVVEVDTPSRFPSDGGDGALLSIGCNNLGQTAPTYIRAAACGVTDFVTVASLGFGTRHMVLVLHTDPY